MAEATLRSFGQEAQNAGSKAQEKAETRAPGSEAIPPRVAPGRQQALPAMATIRVLGEDDVPAAAALFARVYPQHRWHSQAACESYFREMLFDNPWRDPELPSWVAEQDERIIGMQAVMPRPMRFQGRPLRVAVSCQFMVDPDKRRSLVALQLMKAYLSGPQDLSLADGASDQSRLLWIGLGGTAPLLYGLHWTRPLRPARYALSLLQEHAVLPAALAFAARPVCALADALAVRLRQNRFCREPADVVEETLDPATMLSHLPDVMDGSALQPVYDARSLAWLLDQTGRKMRHGTLRARAVLKSDRKLIGWYLYYLQPNAVSEVVQLAALDGSFDQVLQRLFADAWGHGATAVCGRLDPRHAQELSTRHSWFRREGPWTLVHSRHADLMAAIHRGDAFLSRLEGEWWLRFQGG
jgi:hypothetical protein